MAILKDRVTIYEVAKVAKVSLATVSRVINNKENVNQETKKRVEVAIEKLKYQPSSLAQGLATSKTTNLAILLPAANYVYISNILAGVIDVGRIYGYRTTVFSYENNDVQNMINNIVSSRCDGIIVFNSQLKENNLARLISYNIPMIVIGSNDIKEKVGYVDIDYITPLKKVIRDYLKKGIKDIAFLRYKSNTMYFLDNICQVIESVYSEFGLTYDNYIDIEDSYHETYEMFIKKFQKKKEFHQVYIAPRDSIAISITNAAYDSGIIVPQAFEVLAIIATKYSDISRPSISSMSVDMYEVGSVAARMLTKLLSGNEENKFFRLQGRYISRGSTK